jgi:hypothetical protein
LELIRQRIEPNIRGFDLKQRKVVRNQSSTEWEEPIIRISSDVFIEHPFVRRANDRTIHRERHDNGDNQFDSNNQAKSSSLSTINTNETRSNCINQRSFIPLPTTDDEDNLQLNNDEE